MKKEESLICIDNPNSISEFLKSPIDKIAAFITGILISDSNDWKLSAGKLVQASIKSRLFKRFSKFSSFKWNIRIYW